MNVAQLAQDIRDNGGFTYCPIRGAALVVGEDTGWAIALRDTEILIGEDFTEDAFGEAVASILARFPDEGVKVGGWFSPERGYMVEAVTVLHVDPATARLVGELRDQDAIFNLATGEEITLRLPVLV